MPLTLVKQGPDFTSPKGIPDREVEIQYPINEALSDTDEGRPESQNQPESHETVTSQQLPIDAEAVDSFQILTLDPMPAPVIKHGMEWRAHEVIFPLNGAVDRIPWSVRSPNGDFIQEGGASEHLSPFDYFLSMFPLRHLSTWLIGLTMFYKNMDDDRRRKKNFYDSSEF